MTELETHLKHVNGFRRKQPIVHKGISGSGTNDVVWQVQWSKQGRVISVDPAYVVWKDAIGRCAPRGKTQSRCPTYKGCSVDPRWHNYSDFVPWWRANQVDGWQLDKDLLVPGNKVYGSDTCLFVPNWLNSFANTHTSYDRGLPAGVCIHKKNQAFVAQCSNPLLGKNEWLGSFSSALDAHLAWKSRKLQLAAKLKDKIDEIDCRLYNNIVSIISKGTE